MRLTNLQRGMIPLLSPRRAFEQASAIFLDWDGCVMIGDKLLSAAHTLLDRHADRIIILSNNSTHLPEDFSQRLKLTNVSVPPERILLAGAETIRWAGNQDYTRIMLLGSTRIRSYARRLGLPLVRDDPDLIILMRDTRFTYAKLSRVSNALGQGAHLVVANGDLTHPGPGGRIVPETGALLAALLACVPDVAISTIGKPGPLLFARACEIAGVSPDQAVMIGDNPDTDGQGALDYGVYPIIIGSDAGLALIDIANW